jgi:hypothetical protein
MSTLDSIMQMPSPSLREHPYRWVREHPVAFLRRRRRPPPPLDAIFASAIGRCSLVRVAFRVVAEGRTHGNLAEMALRNGSFEDLMTTGDALAHVVDTIATVRHWRRRCECER